MKHIATMALMLNLGLAGIYAQQRPVKMTASGSMVATTINLAPNTITDEVILEGSGALGSFTFRELRADATSPVPSSTCTVGPNIPVVSGGGVFRFRDGSLLTVVIKEGALCIDLGHGVGHLSMTYEVTGGTERFQGASGTLKLTAAVTPVFFIAPGVVPFSVKVPTSEAGFGAGFGAAPGAPGLAPATGSSSVLRPASLIFRRRLLALSALATACSSEIFPSRYKLKST